MSCIIKHINCIWKKGKCDFIKVLSYLCKTCEGLHFEFEWYISTIEWTFVNSFKLQILLYMHIFATWYLQDTNSAQVRYLLISHITFKEQVILDFISTILGSSVTQMIL
jgi:hypothetical protein